MTEWMWMTKEGIDEPAQVTRESFRLCHEPHGWVEYTPPAVPVESLDVQPPADETSEPTSDSSSESTEDSTTSTRRRSAAPKE